MLLKEIAFARLSDYHGHLNPLASGVPTSGGGHYRSNLLSCSIFFQEKSGNLMTVFNVVGSGRASLTWFEDL